jgi:hypothetical protein
MSLGAWYDFLKIPSDPGIYDYTAMPGGTIPDDPLDTRPLTLRFDPSLPYVEQIGDNRGCPLGYFAQRVAPGEYDAEYISTIGLHPGGSVMVRCRRQAGYTAVVNAQETGMQAADNWYRVTQALPDLREPFGHAMDAVKAFGLIIAGVLAIQVLGLFKRR